MCILTSVSVDCQNSRKSDRVLKSEFPTFPGFIHWLCRRGKIAYNRKPGQYSCYQLASTWSCNHCLIVAGIYSGGRHKRQLTSVDAESSFNNKLSSNNLWFQCGCIIKTSQEGVYSSVFSSGHYYVLLHWCHRINWMIPNSVDLNHPCNGKYLSLTVEPNWSSSHSLICLVLGTVPHDGKCWMGSLSQ